MILLHGTEDEMFRAVNAAVNALVMIHSFELDGVKTRSTSDDLARLRLRSNLLRAIGSHFAQESIALVDELDALTPLLPKSWPAALHGDFSPRQLIVNGDRVTLLDFDDVSFGDPAIDIGRFTARVRLLVMSRPDLRYLPEVLLSQYVAKSSRRSIEARVHVQEAISLLDRTLRRFERNPPREFLEEGDIDPSMILREVAACLARSRASLAAIASPSE
jgi:aminoglycoside phosphotransferase (APT) family kinase protein